MTLFLFFLFGGSIGLLLKLTLSDILIIDNNGLITTVKETQISLATSHFIVYFIIFTATHISSLQIQFVSFVM